MESSHPKGHVERRWARTRPDMHSLNRKVRWGTTSFDLIGRTCYKQYLKFRESQGRDCLYVVKLSCFVLFRV